MFRILRRDSHFGAQAAVCRITMVSAVALTRAAPIAWVVRAPESKGPSERWRGRGGLDGLSQNGYGRVRALMPACGRAWMQSRIHAFIHASMYPCSHSFSRS